MTLSICMATHNGESYISDQLASILPQLEADDELVISDDSSTDGTLAAVDALVDARIRLLPGNTFYSPIYNIENAIRQSKGDIIVLSDQDNVWLDNKLAVVRRWFDTRALGINTLVLDGFITDEKGRVISDSIFTNLDSGAGLFRNLYRNTYMGCCMAFSRELLSVALPFPPHIPMHDSWLGLLSEVYGHVEFIPEKTINFRRHARNRSYRPFTVMTQIKWRLCLAYQLARRAASRPGRPAKNHINPPLHTV
jgi:glycosyltransferase involved in cell wall biosynthesis